MQIKRVGTTGSDYCFCLIGPPVGALTVPDLPHVFQPAGHGATAHGACAVRVYTANTKSTSHLT